MNKDSDLKETDQSVTESDHLDFKIAIQIASNALQKQHEGFDSVKNTAKTYLQTASLVMGLVSGLQLANPVHSPSSSYQTFFICMLVAYAVSIAMSLWLVAPVRIFGPIDPQWDVIQAYIIGKTNHEVLYNYLNGLSNACEKNSPILKKRIVCTNITGCVFGLMIVFLALMVILI